MEAPRIITVDGKKYMSTKTAADIWRLKPRTVSDYCNSGKIINKFKNGRYGWYIDINEIRPLSVYEIRRFLILTLTLKNNPEYEIDWDSFDYDNSAIEVIYKNLVGMGYIYPFSIENKQKIPYEVNLTPQGLDLVTSYKQPKKPNYSEIVGKWLPIMISLAQLYFQIAQSA